MKSWKFPEQVDLTFNLEFFPLILGFQSWDSAMADFIKLNDHFCGSIPGTRGKKQKCLAPGSVANNPSHSGRSSPAATHPQSYSSLITHWPIFSSSLLVACYNKKSVQSENMILPAGGSAVSEVGHSPMASTACSSQQDKLHTMHLIRLA